MLLYKSKGKKYPVKSLIASQGLENNSKIPEKLVQVIRHLRTKPRKAKKMSCREHCCN